MGLAELQAAAARLCTDAAARRLLLEDPAAFARATALGLEEMRTLAEQAADFEKFARSLMNKRTHEAGRALPLSVSVLGQGFRPLFESFAADTPIARDPASDAVAFVEWLLREKKVNDAVREVGRYERADLRFRLGSCRAQLYIFHFRGRPPAFLPRLCVALWWRFGGQRRYFQWPKVMPRVD